MRLLLALLIACTDDPKTDTGPAPDDSEPVEVLDEDFDGFQADEDCDDGNPAVWPGASEQCDGLDNDCDGATDEPYDADGDGWLTDDEPLCRELATDFDCDDLDATVNPDAVEVCDDLDNNCDGQTDELGAGIVDADGDGSSACEDCDDADASSLPGGTEICDGADNDCDGWADMPWDDDADGVSECGGDCDDDNYAVFPGATEICDGQDNDCDDEEDEGYDADADGFLSCHGDCDDSDPDVYPWAVELCDDVDNDCNDEIDDVGDEDGDGYQACDDDCDDGNADVHPGATEVCDGADNDCDGSTYADEEDLDGDGSYVCEGDCDDADAARAPGLLEVCDGQDNDCDSGTDETLDNDGDGDSACDGDCDDSDPDAALGGTEVCDAHDNDCDGSVDEGGVCGSCTVAEYGDHTYLYCPSAESWGTSRSACRGWDNYDLVSINDADEDDEVFAAASAVAVTYWWIGLNDFDTEGTYVWSNGDTYDYSDWSSGEPNNSGNEDCAHYYTTGQWNDIPCTSAYYYICESTE